MKSASSGGRGKYSGRAKVSQNRGCFRAEALEGVVIDQQRHGTILLPAV
jgi:hypothetical protein